MLGIPKSSERVWFSRSLHFCAGIVVGAVVAIGTQIWTMNAMHGLSVQDNPKEMEHLSFICGLWFWPGVVLFGLSLLGFPISLIVWLPKVQARRSGTFDSPNKKAASFRKAAF